MILRGKTGIGTEPVKIRDFFAKLFFCLNLRCRAAIRGDQKIQVNLKVRTSVPSEIGGNL